MDETALKYLFTAAAIMWIVVWWVLPVWVCVARAEERSRNGWAWGLLFGWLGVLMIFALPARKPSRKHVATRADLDLVSPVEVVGQPFD